MYMQAYELYTCDASHVYTRWQRRRPAKLAAGGASGSSARVRQASVGVGMHTLPARCLPSTSTRIRPRHRHRHCSTMRREWSASTVAASTARRVVSSSRSLALAHEHLDAGARRSLSSATAAIARLRFQLCYGAQRAGDELGRSVCLPTRARASSPLK